MTTPVWFATSHGTIYVETYGAAGKLKRLRHTPRVTLAACTYSGNVTGPVYEGYARILTEPAESAAAAMTLEKKYGIMRSLYHFVRAAGCLFERKAYVEDVYIAIKPTTGSTLA